MNKRKAKRIAKKTGKIAIEYGPIVIAALAKKGV